MIAQIATIAQKDIETGPDAKDAKELLDTAVDVLLKMACIQTSSSHEIPADRELYGTEYRVLPGNPYLSLPKQSNTKIGR